MESEGSDEDEDEDARYREEVSGELGDEDNARRNNGTSDLRDDSMAHERDEEDDGVDEDTLRILMSTDNHLGFNETDPVRGLDSFATLEEVLYLAKYQYRADMVLLAGDLFHDNKPTCRTMFKTMELLRKYCMGPNPVRIQIINKTDSEEDRAAMTEATQNANVAANNAAEEEEDVDRDQSRRVRMATQQPRLPRKEAQHQQALDQPALRNAVANYLDENYSVDLPIFSIHGNHDDPTRGGGTELLAALDFPTSPTISAPTPCRHHRRFHSRHRRH